jgi:hypothetical protein
VREPRITRIVAQLEQRNFVSAALQVRLHSALNCSFAAHSEKGSAVSREALKRRGLSFICRYYGVIGRRVNGEQGWLCTKFTLLFALSSVVFRHKSEITYKTIPNLAI